MRPRDQDAEFIDFATAHEPALRRAFVASYGAERGMEACAEAFAYAWQHWRRIRDMRNPVGYLYRVGQSKTRPRKRPRFVPDRSAGDPEPPVVEPGLAAALAALSEPQRVAVVLVHGFDWTLRDVAELTGVTVSTVRTHLERGLDHLRNSLEVEDNA
jgi:DNA-directed RNA polymerase specialized sigma24 family protein